MGPAPDPDKVLCSTNEKANFYRVTRLLISGGTTLLKEIFDLIHTPSHLPTVLKNPATEKQLKSARLSKPQWDCLYPSPGVYGTSTDFDVTLLFKLLRTICGLAPPATGWDALPTSADLTLTADLARIKHYRNSVYGHVNLKMEITNDEFLCLWQEISSALLRIARTISSSKETEWQNAIDHFLRDPLTAEDDRNVHELLTWYQNDTEIKKAMEELKTSNQKGMECLEKAVRQEAQEIKVHLGKNRKCVQGDLERTARAIEQTVRKEAHGIKDQLGEELNDKTHKVQEGMERLEKSLKDGQGDLERTTHATKETVREEAKDIKDQLGAVHHSIERLSTSVDNSHATGGQLK